MNRTILVNGNPVTIDFEAENVTELIKGLYSSGHLKGEVVRAVRFEGENLLLADQTMERTLPEGTLELETVPAEVIVFEILKDANEIRADLVKELMDAVEKIRIYGSEEAASSLKRSADLMLLVVSLFSSLDEFLKSWPVGDIELGFSAFKDDITGVMRRFLELMEAQSYGELADLIEYELVPILEELNDSLEQTANKLNGAREH